MSKILSEECTSFLEFWKTLRGLDELMPSSSDFLDSSNPKHIPNVNIFDVEENESILRFVGSRVVERWGQDLTGKCLLANMPLSLQRVFSENHNVANAFPCGVAMITLFVSSESRQLEERSITLPLGTNPGRPNRMVAFTQTVEALDYQEVSKEYRSVTSSEWVDIGAGVPELAPTMTLT